MTKQDKEEIINKAMIKKWLKKNKPTVVSIPKEWKHFAKSGLGSGSSILS